MGMDIYLQHATLTAKREEVRRTFHHAAVRRDRETDEAKRAKLHEQVEKWFVIMHCPENGSFRVNYNDYSLSYWLMYNIDPQAKGEWGIEPFYSAIQGKEEPLIDSDEFRAHLLETARRWYEKAMTLKDQESSLMVFNLKRSNPKKNRWVKKKVILKPEETNSYLDWLKDLVTFAELAVKTKSPIEVSA